MRLSWRAGLIVNKTGPLMYDMEVAPGIIWSQPIDQLKPTAVKVSDFSEPVAPQISIFLEQIFTSGIIQ